MSKYRPAPPTKKKWCKLRSDDTESIKQETYKQIDKQMRLSILAMAAVALGMAACSQTNQAEAKVDAEEPQTEEQTQTPAEPVNWMPDTATVTESGLGIVIKNAGNEKRADRTTPVTLHYRGRLTNGMVFDSSYDRGEPATFSAAQVIPGFGEGIMMIGEGGSATLYIPSELAYGAAGAGALIGPNENLIFDIEVLQIGQ